MSLDILLANLLNPPVLFFFLGMLAVWVKSDLEIPQPVPKLLSMYLLLAIGFKGGSELAHSGFSREVATAMGAAMVMALVVPIYCFFILRWKMNVPNAAAVAATFGSVGAVTFIAAAALLDEYKLPYSGHMVAALAIMESPAIIAGVLLARWYGTKDEDKGYHWSELLRDAFFNGSIFVLVGSLIIGMLTGERGGEALKPFTHDLFKGVLCLFLLDMGIVSARRLTASKTIGWFEFTFSLVVPLLNGIPALVIGYYAGWSQGDTLLFASLCGSASYIAVPAAMRLALPEANPGLYVTMALAITFPFNVIIGLPVYMTIIKHFWI